MQTHSWNKAQEDGETVQETAFQCWLLNYVSVKVQKPLSTAHTPASLGSTNKRGANNLSGYSHTSVA